MGVFAWEMPGKGEKKKQMMGITHYLFSRWMDMTLFYGKERKKKGLGLDCGHHCSHAMGRLSTFSGNYQERVKGSKGWNKGMDGGKREGRREKMKEREKEGKRE